MPLTSVPPYLNRHLVCVWFNARSWLLIHSRSFDTASRILHLCSCYPASLGLMYRLISNGNSRDICLCAGLLRWKSSHSNWTRIVCLSSENEYAIRAQRLGDSRTNRERVEWIANCANRSKSGISWIVHFYFIYKFDRLQFIGASHPFLYERNETLTHSP